VAIPPSDEDPPVDPLAAAVLEAVRTAAERLSVFDKPALIYFPPQKAPDEPTDGQRE